MPLHLPTYLPTYPILKRVDEAPPPPPASLPPPPNTAFLIHLILILILRLSEGTKRTPSPARTPLGTAAVNDRRTDSHLRSALEYARVVRLLAEQI